MKQEDVKIFRGHIRHHTGKENIPWLKDDILQNIIDDWANI
jgi:hypothetical protein